MQYLLIVATSVDEFNELTDRYASEGWEPLFGQAVTEASNEDLDYNFLITQQWVNKTAE